MGPRKSCSRAVGAHTSFAWFSCSGYRRTRSLVKLCPDQSRPLLVVQYRTLIATHGSCRTMTPRSPTLPGTSIHLTEALNCHGYCQQSSWQCSKEGWIQFRGGGISQGHLGSTFPILSDQLAWTQSPYEGTDCREAGVSFAQCSVSFLADTQPPVTLNPASQPCPLRFRHAI